MSPIVISESAVEPITLAEAAENLNLMPDTKFPPVYAQGARITRLIKAARQACERELQVSLVSKVLEIAQHRWWYGNLCWRGIELPLGPVGLIVSVTYVDNTTGLDVVLAADQYRVDMYTDPPCLLPAYNVTWPAVRWDLNSVRVRYEAGYANGASPPVLPPEPIIQAMHLHIAHYFVNRSAVDDDTLAELPMGAQYLLRTYRQGLGV